MTVRLTTNAPHEEAGAQKLFGTSMAAALVLALTSACVNFFQVMLLFSNFQMSSECAKEP